VWLADPDTGDLVCEAAWGYNPYERSKLVQLRLPASLSEGRLDSMKPFVIGARDIPAVPGIQTLFGNLVFAVAPLKLDGGRCGAIAAAAPALGDYEFSDRKVRLLGGIAYQARLAINNAGSFENLETTFLSTVEALANALEAKDEYTSSHARSITDMALEVGYRLGMRSRGLKRLELAALFHDIGKIGIPSDILMKPGPLTDEEREIMKKHPELGEMILAPIDRLAEVRPIVRHCHEHFDGSGYPDGKSATEIPIESRIVLVCDAFHAMTTDRPYRRRLTFEEACKRLRDASGTQFDPAIVDMFLTLLEETPAFAATP
jgi:HD-GYP domain-containing protein (c-di-GMP phosphodiesterase class II)